MPAPYSSPQRLTIRSKVLLGFGIVLAMLSVIASVSVRSTRSFTRTAEWVAHTQHVLELQERLFRHLMEMESQRRGFLLTGDERYLEGYDNARSRIVENFNTLKVLTADTPAQTTRLEVLRTLLERSFELQEAEVEARRGSGPDAARDLFAQGESESLDDAIRALIAQLEREERRILTERANYNASLASGTTVAVLAGGALTFVALLTACVLILRDVAARKKAEEALAEEHNLLGSIIDAMPNHVFVKDVKGRFILDNLSHRKFLGLEPGEGVEGRTVQDYFAPEIAERFREGDRRVLEQGESLLNEEECVMLSNEGVCETWLETTKVPLRDRDGQTIGLVGVSADISERKEAEETLRRFADQLERSNAELQSFASVASHDLQEPLRKIQAFGDRLKARCGDQLSEQGRDYLARMQNAAQRMQVLIQDLLKLSRVTSRAQPFERCNLAEIVHAVLSDLELLVEQTSARIEVGHLPVLDADPVQMRQLFQNLIANAIKFHKPGEVPEVIISGREFVLHENLIPGASAGERVCQIQVQDNGIGFEEKFAEQVFVVFQRLHTREEYEGTGIGLAVCRKITDRHGGSIVAKSAAGEGAVFIITLPMKQPTLPFHD
jgi:two-component system sensor kinase FixL